MKILGIDYGRSKTGLAISFGKLADPYKVIRQKNIKQLADEIEKIAKKEGIEKIVVGVSEGEIAKESKKLAKLLRAETFDETLSTKDAQRLSIESGIKRKKRKEMEDAYAASLILQEYLDSIC